MALTDFEKGCIDDIYSASAPKDRRRPSLEQQANLNAIKHGSEVERQALIATYINGQGLLEVAAAIAACDGQTADIDAHKKALVAKQAAMTAYVTP